MYDLVIIGGGIIGMATAMQMLTREPSLRLLLLEKETEFASHQSGHNSGVIHSGIYYKPGSLKAKLCVEGAAAMHAFTQEHRISTVSCGKVIVATQPLEFPWLDELAHRAEVNGVRGVQRIGPARLREIEPHVTGLAALHLPNTAITDYAAVTRRMAEIVRNHGGETRTGTEVLELSNRDDEVIVMSSSGEFRTKHVINCAGLHSNVLARKSGANLEMQIVPFRGEYFELVPDRRHLVQGLIYPVPDLKFPFLGVHFTKTVQGGVEAGPNAVLALKREGYKKYDFRVADVAHMTSFPGFWRMSATYWKTGLSEYYRSLSKTAFTRALQKLVPEIRENDLVSPSSGVRAQAVDRSGKLLDDFHFVTAGRIIHVCNVPSPAATASLAIARTIIDMAATHFNLVPRSTSANAQ